MAALSNQELTQQLQALQSGMRIVEMTLESIVPKMDASIQESKNLAEDIKRQLTTHVDPIVKADVIGTLAKVDQNHILLAKTLDSKILEVHEAVQKMNDQLANAKSVSDPKDRHVHCPDQRTEPGVHGGEDLERSQVRKHAESDCDYACIIIRIIHGSRQEVERANGMPQTHARQNLAIR